MNRARLDVRTRWQDSTVVDPVTGLDRMLSAGGGFRGDVVIPGENRYAYDIDFRQDLQTRRVSWGIGLAERARRVLYKANELDIFDEGHDLYAFVETTRWLGLKITLEGLKLLNFTATRERTIYVGARSFSPVSRIERREGDNGARLMLRASGSF